MIALLFPGQGAQQVGMGRELAAQFPVAADTFAEASDALGYDLTRIIFEGPEEDLVRTDVCQPAILAMSVACLRVARDHGLRGCRSSNPNFSCQTSLRKIRCRDLS